jgi:hypothetical protein
MQLQSLRRAVLNFSINYAVCDTNMARAKFCKTSRHIDLRHAMYLSSSRNWELMSFGSGCPTFHTFQVVEQHKSEPPVQLNYSPNQSTV